MTAVPSQSRDSFPALGSDDDKLRSVLRHAVRAPSGHNTQPWLFSVADGALHVYADRRRRLPVVDPDDRALTISCGAAVTFTHVALRHFGYAGSVQLLPDPSDPDLLATITLGDAHRVDPEDEKLFHAIELRHTHRVAFEERPVPERVLAAMRADAERAGAELWLVGGVDRQRLAELVGEGDRVQLADERFRDELASWVRSNLSRADDGIPAYAFGIGDLASLLGPWVIRHVDTGERQAEKDRRLALAAPAVGVIGTPTDQPIDWLAAGQALGVLLLRGAAYGVQASFLNQPIETPSLRPRVRALLGHEGQPQLLLRLGYATGDRSTPRREPPMGLEASAADAR